jgi:integrase
MRQLIEAYIQHHIKAWAPSTLKTEYSKLRALMPYLTGDAERLWDVLQSRKPYTRVTLWSRVSHFWGFLIAKGYKRGENPYALFKEQNARLFKHVYEPNLPALSFSEAKKRIESLSRPDVRAVALDILNSGMRSCEVRTEVNGSITGKGGKKRKLFVQTSGERVSYNRLWRALRSVGLKPHTLRKIRATQLAREGLREADLCKVFGWASYETAKPYVAPIDDEALKQKMST